MAGTDSQIDNKKRARRRLVGAVALALLAATVFPMVMDHEPRSVGQDIDIRIPGQSSGTLSTLSVAANEPTSSDVARNELIGKDGSPEATTPPVVATSDAAAPNKTAEVASVGAAALAAKSLAKSDVAADQAPSAKPEVKAADEKAAKEIAAKEIAAKEKATATKLAADKAAADKAATAKLAAEILAAEKAAAKKAEKKPAEKITVKTDAKTTSDKVIDKSATKPTEKAADKSEAKPADTHKGGKWVVQLGVFSDAENVSRVRTRVQAHGFSSYTEKLKGATGKVQTRVRAGPFATKEAAEKARDTLKRNGLAGIVAEQS